MSLPTWSIGRNGADSVSSNPGYFEQRMLSLARVMVEEPKLLIADELFLGLAPIVVEHQTFVPAR